MFLQKIGETRWWAKQAALQRVIGSFQLPKPEFLHIIIVVLNTIRTSSKFNANKTFEAGALIDKWYTYAEL